MVAGLGPAGRVGDVEVQDQLQPGAQPAPVAAHVLHAQRLQVVDRAGPQPQVHAARSLPRRRLQRVGVETQLQHVAGLGLLARELGVDRLDPRHAVLVDDPDEEVRNASDAVVHQGHLVQHVPVVVGQRVADAWTQALKVSPRSFSGMRSTRLPARS